MSTTTRKMLAATIAALALPAILAFSFHKHSTAAATTTIQTVCAEFAVAPLAPKTEADAASLAPVGQYHQYPTHIAQTLRANDVLTNCGPLELGR
jgi:hypothetical protein